MLIFLFALTFAINTMQAIFFSNSFNGINIDQSNNKDQKDYSSIFKSTIQCANSAGGFIYVGTGLIGASSLLTLGVPIVLDPLITEASMRIDAQENPKSGLAMGLGNLAIAGLYGVMLQSAGLLNPVTFTWTGLLWGLKGTKCLVTAACQFVLVGKALRDK